MTILEAKCCPFCDTDGSAMGLNLINRPVTSEEQHGCFIECDCCQAQGPWHAYVEDEGKALDVALKLWNARSAYQFAKADL